MDAASLSADPCKLDIVLLPFDEDKGGPEEWQHYSGAAIEIPTSHAWVMLLRHSPTQPWDIMLSWCASLGNPVTGGCIVLMCAAGEMNGRELQKFSLEAFPSFVTRVTDSAMQQFMSPDMGTPRVFLFTDKDETPAVYAALSVNLRRYKYKFADVHSSEAALMQQFNVKKVGRTSLQTC